MAKRIKYVAGKYISETKGTCTGCKKSGKWLVGGFCAGCR